MYGLALTASVAVCLASFVAAPEVRAQDETENASPDYVVEIGHGENSCSISPISGRDRQGGAFFGPGRRPPSPEVRKHPLAEMVKVRVRPFDDLWQIEVSVEWGEFPNPGRKTVGTFQTRTNDRVEIKEVELFGLKPFTVGVVKVLDRATRPPSVVNKTQSLSVEKLDVAPLAPYRLKIRNLSGKAVLEFEISAAKGGRRLSTAWPAQGGWRLEPLIMAGGFYAYAMPSSDGKCGGARGYWMSQSDTVEISSVVFADGSYEGDPAPAARITARALGNEKHLARVVEALRVLSGRSEPDASEAAAYLNEQLAAMDETVEPAMLDELHNLFPGAVVQEAVQMSGEVRFGAHRVRQSLLADVMQFESKGGETRPAKFVRAWLSEKLAKYESWLAAARALTHKGAPAR